MSNYVKEKFFKNKQGRYEGIKSGNYVTCGEPVTLYCDGMALAGVIEHNGTDYYFYSSNGSHKELYEGVEMKIK